MDKELFRGNEIVINGNYRVRCPFDSNMINVIGCFPSNSQKIPCRSKSIRLGTLSAHLHRYHHISLNMAKKIVNNYNDKLQLMRSTSTETAP